VVMDLGVAWLVFADVDGTLIGDDRGWSNLGAALNANPNILMIPNSSRPLTSLQESWDRLQPQIRFPAQVGALGTEVSVGGKDVGWSGQFGPFDRDPIDRAMATMGYRTNGDEYQTSLKASYSVPQVQWASATSTLNRPTSIQIVTSGDSDFDVIPKGAGKAAPISFLADHFQVERSRIVGAGDSMNDLSMLRSTRHRIVVANADEALRESTKESAFQSASSHADGVIEGLRALGAMA